MLIQFTVENFLSFQAATVFSLRATGDEQMNHHVVRDAKGLGVLRAAALYGANAAGKSNLVLALDFARRLILSGTRGDERIGVRPFKLAAIGSGLGAEPSRFEFIFRHNGTLYSYGFVVGARRVHEEWLFATFDKREVRLFERATDEDNKTQVEFGAQFVKGSGVGKGRGFLNFVAQGTRANQLFLSECSERNVGAAAAVAEWFESLRIIRADTQWQGWPMALRVDQRIKQFASNFLRAAGTGVEAVESEELPIDIKQFLSALPENERQEISQEIQDLGDEESLMLPTTVGHFHVVLGEDRQPCLLNILTVHHSEDGKDVRFRLEEESEGTQRLFHLIPALFMLKHSPQVLVIDEIDRRLHPLLTRLFIQQALDCDQDEAQGQLIFTTHDTNLLDLDLLRRDEIWFVEKDSGGATHLASLAEWKLNGAKVRHDLDIEKHYLRGRFGAIPFFGDTSRLLCAPSAEPQQDGSAAQPAQAQEAAA